MQYETDRARFLSRGRGIRTLMSVIDGRPLSNTVSAVLVPMVSLRHHVRLTPGVTARATFSTLRLSSAALTRNTRGQSALWAHGISGDVPIVLVRIDESEDRDIIRQLFRTHEYWRMNQLAVDLVILNERATSYAQDLQASLEAQVRTSQARSRHEGQEPHGNVFILRADLVLAEDSALLQTAARAVLLSRRGTLAE